MLLDSCQTAVTFEAAWRQRRKHKVLATHPHEHIMKVFNIVFIVLFVLFAAVQYNDPDPYLWMPVYLYAALLCYFALKRKHNPTLYLIGFVAYGLYAVYLLFDKTGVLDWAREHHGENIAQTMKATKPWIEETREFFGLVIVIVVLAVNRAWLLRQKSARQPLAS